MIDKILIFSFLVYGGFCGLIDISIIDKWYNFIIIIYPAVIYFITKQQGRNEILELIKNYDKNNNTD